MGGQCKIDQIAEASDVLVEELQRKVEVDRPSYGVRPSARGSDAFSKKRSIIPL